MREINNLEFKFIAISLICVGLEETRKNASDLEIEMALWRLQKLIKNLYLEFQNRKPKINNGQHV